MHVLMSRDVTEMFEGQVCNSQVAGLTIPEFTEPLTSLELLRDDGYSSSP